MPAAAAVHAHALSQYGMYSDGSITCRTLAQQAMSIAHNQSTANAHTDHIAENGEHMPPGNHLGSRGEATANKELTRQPATEKDEQHQQLA
jgi:hypothetical protein